MAWVHICCRLSRAAICISLATGVCTGSVTLGLWAMRGTSSVLLLEMLGWSSLLAHLEKEGEPFTHPWQPIRLNRWMTLSIILLCSLIPYVTSTQPTDSEASCWKAAKSCLVSCSSRTAQMPWLGLCGSRTSHWPAHKSYW